MKSNISLCLVRCSISCSHPSVHIHSPHREQQPSASQNTAPPHFIHHRFTPCLQNLDLLSFPRLAYLTWDIMSRLIFYTVHKPHLLPLWVDPGWSHILATVDSAMIMAREMKAVPDGLPISSTPSPIFTLLSSCTYTSTNSVQEAFFFCTFTNILVTAILIGLRWYSSLYYWSVQIFCLQCFSFGICVHKSYSLGGFPIY